MSLADCRHVFVVTNARSGAALLQSLLNCTDGVQIRGENQNALFHRFRCSAAVSTAAGRGRAGRQAAPDKPWFAAGGIRPLFGQIMDFPRELSPDARIISIRATPRWSANPAGMSTRTRRN